MIIRLTAACNNRCRFCLVDDEIAAGAFRPFAAIAAEIDRVEPDETIDIFGGEPTIYPSFWRILERALESGRTVTLATNCRLFSHQPAAERLEQVGGGRLLVRSSLLGHDAALHNRLNGVLSGAFDQTLAGIANLSARGFDVQTNIVVMSENLDHLLGTAIAAAAAGSRHIKLSGLVRSGRVLDLVPDPQQVRRRLATLVPLLRSLGLTVRLEKLTPCVVPDFLDILHRESDPSSPSASWFAKTPHCADCALAAACDGAECGALARFGDDWLEPFSTLPNDLVAEVAATALSEFVPRRDRPLVRVVLPEGIEEALALLPAVAEFGNRNPHLFLVA